MQGTEFTEVNLFAFASRLFHEDFSLIYRGASYYLNPKVDTRYCLLLLFYCYSVLPVIRSLSLSSDNTSLLSLSHPPSIHLSLPSPDPYPSFPHPPSHPLPPSLTQPLYPLSITYPSSLIDLPSLFIPQDLSLIHPPSPSPDPYPSLPYPSSHPLPPSLTQPLYPLSITCSFSLIDLPSLVIPQDLSFVHPPSPSLPNRLSLSHCDTQNMVM